MAYLSLNPNRDTEPHSTYVWSTKPKPSCFVINKSKQRVLIVCRIRLRPTSVILVHLVMSLILRRPAAGFQSHVLLNKSGDLRASYVTGAILFCDGDADTIDYLV